MKIFRSLIWNLLLGCACRLSAEPLPFPLPGHTPQASFCVAYVIRDADERDSRPAPGDPFATNGESIPHGILRSDGNVDVASLASLTTAQARLTQQQIAAVHKAVIEGQSRFPVMECYEPHHAIICYSEDGKPLSCIEICFTCNGVKIAPNSQDTSTRFVAGADLIALGRIFKELKLPLTLSWPPKSGH